MENLKRVQPTTFFGVPRVWEKIAEKMQQVGRSNTGLKKAVGNWAKAAATEHHTLVREGKIKPDQASLSYKLARKLVLRYIYHKPYFKIFTSCNKISYVSFYFTAKFAKP